MLSGEPSLTYGSNLSSSSISVSTTQWVINQNVQLTASNVAGYRFVYWYDVNFNRIVSFDSTLSVVMDGPKRFRAVYEKENSLRVYIESNVSHDEGSLQRSVELNTVGYIEAKNITNASFKHWVNLITQEVISTQSALNIELDQDAIIGAVYDVLTVAQERIFNFSGQSKTSYASAELVVNDVVWILNDALIGTHASDQKLNNASIRLRDGDVQSITSFAKIEKVSFYAGNFGSDSPQLEIYLMNETTEFLLNSLEPKTLSYYEIDVTAFQLPDALAQGPYRISFRSPTIQRVNLDQITLITRNTQTPVLPTLGLPQGIPNNSQRLNLEFTNKIKVFSYQDEYMPAQCVAIDSVTNTTQDCLVEGSVNTAKLGEYDITYYAIDADGFYASQQVTKVVLRDASLLDFEYSQYYEGIEGLYGTELKLAVRNLLLNTVVHQSYGDARDILQEADADLEEPDKILLIYNRAVIVSDWDNGVSWAREHVWPNSRLGVPRAGNTDRNIATDLHNLRAINPGVNSARGNKFFDFETTTMTYYPGEDRGDVARIYFYMVTMYDHLVLRDNFADGDTYTVEGAIQGVLSALIQFHYEDLVDAFERQRNDVIFTYQRNRNPFIDYPHLVELIWFDHPAIPLP